MALDFTPGMSVQSSPTLSGLHSHTPSTSTPSLHRMSNPGSSSPTGSSSPIAPLQGDRSHWRGQNDNESHTTDENISALDPRRFTPNLHASLVAEILSLRREIESKNTMLGHLEEDLHTAKAENEELNKSIQDRAAEGRSTKKELHLLENGSRLALDEMSKERDEAIDGLNDTRRRLEVIKNRLRTQEEEAERSRGLWDRDRQAWDVEKRNMDRKVHVVEGRLRTLLAEVAAAQANGSYQSSMNTDVDEGMRETWFTKSSDSISNPSNSVIERSRSSGMSNGIQDGSDVPNFRSSSSLSGLFGFGGTSLQGLSLAEELEFDEEENNGEEIDLDGGPRSPGALPEESQMKPRRLSLRLLSQDDKARKVLGLLAQTNESLVQEAIRSVDRGESREDKKVGDLRNHLTQYKDEAIQYSPPASPPGHVQDVNNPVEKTMEQTEHVANQRRKRVSIVTSSSEQTQAAKSGHRAILPMVSAGCQTLEPLSPPQTPVKLSIASDAISFPEGGPPEMKSAMTQTADHNLSKMSPADTRPDSVMTVPIIAIHPPASRPASSHNGVVLPPRTKNAACQVSIQVAIPSRSVAVQTQDTKRPPRIPLRVISSTQQVEKSSTKNQTTSPRKNPRKNVPRPSHVNPAASRMRSSAGKVTDSYPGNNDDGPLSQHSSDLRRPIRSDSLFAGFESKNDQQVPRLPPIDFSDDEFATMAPIRKTLSKVHNSWKLIPNAKTPEPSVLDSDDEQSTNVEKTLEPIPDSLDSPAHARQLRSKETSGKPLLKSSPPVVASQPPNVRKSGPTSSRAAAHTSQAASISTASSAHGTDLVLPPFPVPTRSSSRRLPISASDGTQSPTPYSTTFFSGRPSGENGKAPSQNAILRKVRSATAGPKFSRNNRRRSRSRSPPASVSTLTAPDSPRLPRLPQHHRKAAGDRNHSIRSRSISPVMEHPIGFQTQPTSVVDAIAQTMVGEWMWKYIRKRKSFGISESPQAEFEVERNNGENNSASGGIRHKRWVWLAPYERAIMWSSKQPTSGPALLGKNGRKLTIQSVIDVKDDTPMPKHSDPPSAFDRSILILTPQRALKFTATTRARHEVWLTALSFLSESGMEPDELVSIPPIPRHEMRHAPSQASLAGFGRATIRDTIGMAKSKERPGLIAGRAHSSPLGVPRAAALSGADGSYEDDDDVNPGAAEPPYVPRVSFYTHSRKRSNTGPRAGVLTTAPNGSTLAALSSPFSLKANASHDGYSAFPGGSAHHVIGQSISEGNASMYTIRNNFFDAVGTVRMEAFIDQDGTRAPSSPGRSRKEWKGQRPCQGRKKDLSYWGVGGSMAPKSHMAGANDTRAKHKDPFRGF